MFYKFKKISLKQTNNSVGGTRTWPASQSWHVVMKIVVPGGRQAPLQGMIPRVDSSEAPPTHSSLLILALVLGVTSQLFLIILPGFEHVRA